LGIDLQKSNISQTSKTNNQSRSTKSLDIETQQIAIQTSQLNIADLERKIKKYNDAMVCKMDGVLSQVNVVEGGFTPTTQPVFKVINPDKLEVTLNINEYNAKLVKPGQAVDISGDSIPESEKITGKVTSVSPVATKNSTSNGSSETVIEVKVSIDNKTESIKPGITVNCDIKTVDIKNVLSIDLEMLKQDKDGNKSILVVDKDKNIMKEKKVVLGTTSDMKAELKGGDVKEGDIAVLNPQPTYKDGSRIKITDGKD
jgi:multidrug efflux pump subunit AcrA (membrane-fusion protein)